MSLFEFFSGLLLSKLLWLIVGALAALYYYLTLQHDYFKNRGVKFVKPLPLFGSMLPTVLRTKNFADTFNDIYKMFPNEKFFGMFEFLQPVYFIRDPEIIKQITVKDFDHFVNHRMIMDEKLEPLFGRSLFVMRDQRWKDMRSTLSPAFTGSKMRNMFSFIADCSKTTINHLLKEANGKSYELEVKDIFTRFTNDVIATCSFGIEVNSLKDPKNDFYEMGKTLTNFDNVQAIKFLGLNSFPKLMKLFKISLFDPKSINFFRTLLHETITYREKEHIIRPDMINLLIQAKQGKLTHSDNDTKDENVGFATVEESEIGKATSENVRKWDDDDLTAQCLIFFLAGFENVAVLMCFIVHELAVNQTIQDRLYAEVKEVKEELNGKPLTYEILQKMNYLDMVVSESLRKWPPNGATDRYCNKEFILDDGNGNKVKLEPGDGLWMPTYSIHRDPKHYPNPEKFDPERFSDENKDSINPFTYFPFGLGPRNCIGSRFVLMESKAIIFYILSSFRIEKSPKTQDPIKLKKNAFNMKPEKGFWINLRPL